MAWFLLDRSTISSTAFTAAASTSGAYYFDAPATFSGYGQWKGFGVVSATPYTFQVGICDSTSTSKSTGLGIFISGSFLPGLMSVLHHPSLFFRLFRFEAFIQSVMVSVRHLAMIFAFVFIFYIFLFVLEFHSHYN